MAVCAPCPRCATRTAATKTYIPKQNSTLRVTPSERAVFRKWQRVTLPVDKLSHPADAQYCFRIDRRC
jgi:hypothetical protein